MVVCVDCAMVIANGEVPDDPVREAEVLAGLEGCGFVVLSDEFFEFSKSPCSCCGSWLAGARFGAEHLEVL